MRNPRLLLLICMFIVIALVPMSAQADEISTTYPSLSVPETLYPATYDVIITNDAGTDRWINLTVGLTGIEDCTEQDENKWRIELDDDRVLVPAGGTATTFLYVSALCDCSLGCRAMVDVNGTYDNSSTTITLETMTTLGVPDPGLSAVDDSGSARNGSSVELQLTIRNSGDIKDGILFSADGLPANWTADFEKDRINLATNDYRTTKVTIGIPELPEMPYAEFMVLGTSVVNNSIVRNVTLWVDVRTNVLVVGNATHYPTYPNASEQFDVMFDIRNDGLFPVQDLKVRLLEGNLVLNDTTLDTVPVSGNTTVTLTAAIHDHGFSYLKITLDPLDELPEWDEDDNELSFEIEVVNRNPRLVLLSEPSVTVTTKVPTFMVSARSEDGITNVTFRVDDRDSWTLELPGRWDELIDSTNLSPGTHVLYIYGTNDWGTSETITINFTVPKPKSDDDDDGIPNPGWLVLPAFAIAVIVLERRRR